MYMTSGGLQSNISGLFQEDHQGSIWAAHANDGSLGTSTALPDAEDIQTLSQGNYADTPENSPRGGYHQNCLPQYESPTARSPESIGSEGPASAMMTAPVTSGYMQMPVLFMMVPMVPGYQQAGLKTRLSR